MLRKHIEEKIQLSAEVEEGNIEYKLRLDLKDKISLNKMASQMLWRLNEGKNLYGKWIAYYYIGIDDRGNTGNIEEKVIDSSIDILKSIIERCQAEITLIDKINCDKSKNLFVAQITIEKIFDVNFPKEFRVCFLGSSGHGKSTSLANLIYQQKDDGKGLARSLVMKHKHERNSGITSSIKHDIIGFKKDKLITYKTFTSSTWESIALQSDIIISLFDLPGSTKYLQTTYYGLSTIKPHLNIIVINPLEYISENKNNENTYCLSSDIISYIKLSLAFNIPFTIIFTNMDSITSDNSNLNFLNKFNNFIKVFDKYINLHEYNNNDDNNKNKILYFKLSNKYDNSDIYYNLFKTVINLDFSNRKYLYFNPEIISQSSTIFNIMEVYKIPDKGIIVSGICINGFIECGKKYYIGSPCNNKFYPCKIETIHKKQVSCKRIYFDECGSLEFHQYNFEINSEIDKNMIIISDDIVDKFKLCSSFSFIPTEDVTKLNIKINSRYLLFVDNLIEPIIINSIKDKILFCKFINENLSMICGNRKCILKSENDIIFGNLFID